MKKIVCLTLLLAIVSAASAQVFFKGTLDEAIAKARAENKKVLLDFTSYT